LITLGNWSLSKTKPSASAPNAIHGPGATTPGVSGFAE
jgi:hypothetical protein